MRKAVCSPADLIAEFVVRRDAFIPYQKNRLVITDSSPFAQLVEEIYKASFAKEEGRSLKFRVLVDRLAFNISVAFDRPITAEKSELIRLAPACDPEHQALKVDLSSGAPLIRGIINDPMLPKVRTVERLFSGEWGRPMLHVGPPPVEIRSLATGHINIIEDYVSVTLHQGSIVDAGMISWIPEYKSWVERASACHCGDGEQGEYHRMHSLIHALWCDICTRMKYAGHGGVLLLLPIGNNTVGSSLETKYSCGRSSLLIDAIRQDILADSAIINDQSAKEYPEWSPIEGRASPVVVRKLFAHRNLDLAARAVTQMSSVDGAVLFGGDLALLGFGAKIDFSAKVAATEIVRRRYDWKAGLSTLGDPVVEDSLVMASLGTRHQSAFAFCMCNPGALAIVVSQDGEMRVFVNGDSSAVLYEGYQPLEQSYRGSPIL